jgi:hypothetical protein
MCGVQLVLEAPVALEQDLLKLEMGFWTEDADYYRQHVDEECLLAFTEFAGVRTNEEIASMRGGSSWMNIDLDEKGLVQLSDGAVLLTYEVNAERKSGEPYKAVVTTGYVKHDREWKMAFHQQTPLEVRPS